MMGESSQSTGMNGAHIKRDAPAHSKIQKAKGRNSSIELLRLIAMLMIVGFHFVFCNSDTAQLSAQPTSVTKFIYQVILMGGGWVGNFIFFVISTWFLLDREATLRKSLRRIWILERELLFWSVVWFAVYMFLREHSMHLDGVSMKKLILQSILPLSSNLWWYPTSYALYLLFLPFLIKGTKNLDAISHRNLAVICLILWGVGGLLPKVQFNLTNSSVFVFIYWFILISYYRWYMRPFSKKFCVGLVIAGIALNVLYWLAAETLHLCTGKFLLPSDFIFDYWKLPSMMIGFVMFLLFEKHHFSSKVVNWIAGSAFGVYLIHYHPVCHELWSTYLPLKTLFASSHPILNGMTCIAGIFLCCLLLDMARHVIFALTIDKHKGAFFDKLYVYAEKRKIMSILKATNTAITNL